jgi:Bacterial extracellular solute-binding protein
MSALVTGRPGPSGPRRELECRLAGHRCEVEHQRNEASETGLGCNKMGPRPFSAPYALAVDHSSGGTGLSFRFLAAFGVSSCWGTMMWSLRYKGRKCDHVIGWRKTAREKVMGPRGTFALAFILGALGALPQSAAGAAELVVLANPGAMPGLRELGGAFSRETGHKVTIIQEGVPEVERRLAANEPGDLISANPPSIEDLLKKGKVIAGTAVPFQVASRAFLVRRSLVGGVRAVSDVIGLGRVQARDHLRMGADFGEYRGDHQPGIGRARHGKARLADRLLPPAAGHRAQSSPELTQFYE